MPPVDLKHALIQRIWGVADPELVQKQPRSLSDFCCFSSFTFSGECVVSAL